MKLLGVIRVAKKRKMPRKDVFQPACFFCRAIDTPLFLIEATLEGQDLEMILCKTHHSEGQKVITEINCNFCMLLAGEISEFELKQISKKDFSHTRDKKTKEIRPAFAKGMCDSCRDRLLDYVTKHPKI